MEHTEGQALRLHGQVLLHRAGAVRETAGSGFPAPLESLLLLLSCLPKSLLLAALRVWLPSRGARREAEWGGSRRCNDGSFGKGLFRESTLLLRPWPVFLFSELRFRSFHVLLV